MKIKNFLLMVICFFLLTVSVSAQPEQKLDQDKVIDIIQKQLSKIDSLYTVLVHKNFLEGPQVESIIKMFFRKPDKFRNEITIKSDQGEFNKKDTFICDGKLLWHLNMFADGNIVEKAIKRRVEENSDQAEEIKRSINPLEIFKQILNQYEIVGVSKEVESGKNIYVLDLEITVEYRYMLEKMLNVEQNQDALNILPEKMKYYWDIDNAYILRTQSFNNEEKMIDEVEHIEVAINSEIEDDLFLYIPSEGVKVRDMSDTSIIAQGEEGTKGSDFALPDFKGNSYSLKSFEGKIVVIDFWAQWCPLCQKELPFIEKLYQNLKNDPEVVLLSITMSKPDVISVFVKKYKYTFPVLFDEGGKVMQEFGAMAIPHVVVIDKTGIISKVYKGYHEGIDELLLKDISSLR